MNEYITDTLSIVLLEPRPRQLFVTGTVATTKGHSMTQCYNFKNFNVKSESTVIYIFKNLYIEKCQLLFVTSSQNSLHRCMSRISCTAIKW